MVHGRRLSRRGRGWRRHCIAQALDLTLSLFIARHYTIGVIRRIGRPPPGKTTGAMLGELLLELLIHVYLRAGNKR